MLGKTPFESGDDKQEMFNDILNKDIEIPQSLSPELQDFLRKLLDKDPETRLGRNGIDEIINHPWLRNARPSGAIDISILDLEGLVMPCDPDIDKNVNIDAVSQKWFDEDYVVRKLDIKGFSVYSGQATNVMDAESVRSVSIYDQDNTEIEIQKSAFRKLLSIGGDANITGLHQSNGVQKIRSNNKINERFLLEFIDPLLPSQRDSDDHSYDQNEIEELKSQEEQLKQQKLVNYELNVFEKFKRRLPDQ